MSSPPVAIWARDSVSGKTFLSPLVKKLAS
jgi:hypothetical protein